MSHLRFLRKPKPVIPYNRPIYKIVLILMVLALCSRSGTASLLKMQLFNWALKSKKRCETLVNFSQKKELRLRVWGMDPALNIALNYAVSEKLIKIVSSGYSISNKGLEFLNCSDALNTFDEAEYLKEIGKGVTEKMIKEIVEKWVNEV